MEMGVEGKVRGRERGGSGEKGAYRHFVFPTSSIHILTDVQNSLTGTLSGT